MKLLVAGSAILDVIARPTSVVAEDASNEAEITWGAGGAGRNVAENLARLGCDVTLVTDLAEDAFGRFLLDNLAGLGIQVRLARRERTGIYLALLRPDGVLDKGFCRTGTEQVTAAELLAVLPDLDTFDGAVIDANLAAPAAEALAARCREAGVPYALETAAHERSRRLAGAIPGSFLVKPDHAEAEALTGLPCRNPREAAACARTLRALGARHVVVSLGAAGFHAELEGFSGHVPAAATTVRDVTGAGDALLSAAFVGLLAGLPPDRILRAAARAAALTCASAGATCPDLSPTLFED